MILSTTEVNNIAVIAKESDEARQRLYEIHKGIIDDLMSQMSLEDYSDRVYAAARKAIDKALPVWSVKKNPDGSEIKFTSFSYGWIKSALKFIKDDIDKKPAIVHPPMDFSDDLLDF